jgi:hypothetical protein
LSLVRKNGEAAALPRMGRCPTGHIARNYLSRAGSPAEEAERTRRLLAFAGRRSWGLSLREVASALGWSKQQVHYGLPDTEAELREIARAIGLSETAVLGGQDAFSGGEGI